MRAPGAVIAAAAAAGLAAGCTFTRTDVSECESNAVCRGEFGVGFECNADGLCEEAAPAPRCTQTFPPDLFQERFENRDRIIIGNLMDRSNETHVARERSAQLAYSQVNQQDGLDGQQFGAIFCTIEVNPDYDDLERADAAVASARFLAEVIGVPAIVGPAASGDTQSVYTELAGDGVLVISPSATSPALTELDPADVSNDAPGLLWRTAPSDALQGAVIAADMLEQRLPAITQVAAIHEIGAYGEGLYEVFEREFSAGGGSVVEFPYTDAGQRADAIADVGASAVQEVLFISSQPGDIETFLDSAASLPGYAEKTIFLTDAAANPDVLDNANSARFPDVRATRPAPLDEGAGVYASFIAAYTAEFRDDVTLFSYAANSYDAAWLVIYGAAWARFREGEVSGRNIARGLRRVSSGNDVDIRPSGWVSVQQAFRQGASVDVAGASGELDYDPATEETASDIQVWTIDGRTATGLYTVSP